MAEPKPKKPRIRKSAPTVRERVEAAQAEAQKPPKAKKVRGVISRLKSLFKQLRPKVGIKLPDSSFGRALGKIGRFLQKILGWIAPRYFINSWHEVRQVTWPARKETWRLTLAVGIFALIFGSMVYGVDKLLDDVFKKFILK